VAAQNHEDKSISINAAMSAGEDAEGEGMVNMAKECSKEG
jgi:hypothetical protein